MIVAIPCAMTYSRAQVPRNVQKDVKIVISTKLIPNTPYKAFLAELVVA